MRDKIDLIYEGGKLAPKVYSSKHRYLNYEVSTKERQLSYDQGLDAFQDIIVDALPDYSNFIYNPRRAANDSEIPFKNIIVRKRRSDKSISIRFRIFPEIRSEFWNRVYNIDTYFLTLKSLVSDRDDIKVFFFQNKEKFAQIVMLDIIIIKPYDTEKTIGEYIKEADNSIREMMILTDNHIDVTGKIKSIIYIWNNQLSLDDEEYWHQLLKNNPWVIAQSLSEPLILFTDKAYLGGKDLTNRYGKIIDALFRNDDTQNICLIELKTPGTKLIGSKYRGVYSVSREVTGSVVQILDYRETILKNYYSLANNNKRNFFKAISPKMILIIGDSRKLNEDEIYSFELFRRELKSIEVITYNELFEKIRILFELINKDLPRESIYSIQ